MKVSKAGAVRLTGVLGDGRSFSAAGGLDTVNTFTFWTPLYQEDFGLSGSVDFTGDTFESLLQWANPANKRLFFSKGWVFFFQAEDGIRDGRVTGVQRCALPICDGRVPVRVMVPG